ncbi:TPA: DUF3305 domain-containing protein [Photobacterium damselae]
MIEQQLEELKKDESIWPIRFCLNAEEKQIGRWTTLSWSIDDVCLYDEDVTEAYQSDACYLLPLALFRDERTDYRFNLSSQDPHLFFVCEAIDNEQLKPVLVTAAQGVAARYMDGDYTVLHISIPLPIQAWMEAYIGRHGELLEFKRKGFKDKGPKEKSRGRSCDK